MEVISETTRLLSIRVPIKTSLKGLYDAVRNAKSGRITVRGSLAEFSKILASLMSDDDLAYGVRGFSEALVRIFEEKFRLKEVLEIVDREFNGFVSEYTLRKAYSKIGLNASKGVILLLLKALKLSGRIVKVPAYVNAFDIGRAIKSIIAAKGSVRFNDLIKAFGEDVEKTIVRMVINGDLKVVYGRKELKVPSNVSDPFKMSSDEAKDVDRVFLRRWVDFKGVSWYAIRIPSNARVMLP